MLETTNSVNQDSLKTKENEAVWKISWGDGYYPFCSFCMYEPDHAEVIIKGIPDTCPRCKRKMTNYKEFNKK